MEPNQENARFPIAAKIAGGAQIHLAHSNRFAAFCKGLRSHRLIVLKGVDVEKITCKVCRRQAEALGYIKAA